MFKVSQCLSRCWTNWTFNIWCANLLDVAFSLFLLFWATVCQYTNKPNIAQVRLWCLYQALPTCLYCKWQKVGWEAWEQSYMVSMYACSSGMHMCVRLYMCVVCVRAFARACVHVCVCVCVCVCVYIHATCTHLFIREGNVYSLLKSPAKSM